MHIPKIKNQIIAITGASSGIGRSIAFELSTKGALVAVMARRKDKLIELETEIHAKLPKAKIIVYEGDIRKKSSTQKFFEFIIKNWGRLDVFVNNAGVTDSDRFADLSPNQIQNMINTNFNGSVWALYYAIKIFEENREGTIINISSTLATKPYPNASLYASTKSGIHSLIKSLQEDYINHKNIKIINISPGATLTDAFKENNHAVNTQNMVLPEDVADFVTYALNSPDNMQITEFSLRQSGQVFNS